MESGGIINLHNLSRECGVPVSTLRTFYQVLEDTFAGYRIPAYGAEVDYILETPDEVIPIEVKATESPREEDARHLKLFLDTYPKQARRGLIVCRCRAPRRLTEQIEAIPWNML
ncbi:MAG: DUF4143 domain-containing protein [Candidatus Marinimicrobia bacterium]|nr:DUF4143 domain-containing protein [Candidatus Neomarinimicrobiota bacterium]